MFTNGQPSPRRLATLAPLRFYQEFGFASTGYDYEEDGIPHVEMLRAPMEQK